MILVYDNADCNNASHLKTSMVSTFVSTLLQLPIQIVIINVNHVTVSFLFLSTHAKIPSPVAVNN